MTELVDFLRLGMCVSDNSPEETARRDSPKLTLNSQPFSAVTTKTNGAEPNQLSSAKLNVVEEDAALSSLQNAVVILDQSDRLGQVGHTGFEASCHNSIKEGDVVSVNRP